MGGTQPGFNAAGFRAAIRQVYLLAAPAATADQASFHFEPTVTWSGPVDGDGVPYDPSATKTVVTKPSVTVPCGIEQVTGSLEVPTRMGDVLQTRLKVYLLDEDHAKVEGAATMTLGGETYRYHHTEPPAALFDVGFWTLVFSAENDL